MRLAAAVDVGTLRAELRRRMALMLLLTGSAVTALHIGGRLRRSRSPRPVLQLQTGVTAGSTQLFLDMKAAMTVQAEKERAMLEPNLIELGPPKPKRGGKPGKKKAGGGGGFGAQAAGADAAANALRVETMKDDGICYVPNALSKELTARLRECVQDELRRSYAAVNEDPAVSIGRFNVPVETHDPYRGYLLLPLRDEQSVLDSVDRGPIVEALAELLGPKSPMGLLFESSNTLPRIPYNTAQTPHTPRPMMIRKNGTELACPCHPDDVNEN